MADPFHITADEINCLIHAYFKDSGPCRQHSAAILTPDLKRHLVGFQHSAFVLRAEGRLEHSPHYRKHVPRGELVELLSKALLFSEVEAHWKGDTMTMACTNQFKLLEHHTCSFDPKFPPPPPPEAHRHHSLPERPPTTHVTSESASVQVNGPSAENSLKRKASGPVPMEEPSKEKRAKTNGKLEGEVDTKSPSVVESRLLCSHIILESYPIYTILKPDCLPRRRPPLLVPLRRQLFRSNQCQPL